MNRLIAAFCFIAVVAFASPAAAQVSNAFTVSSCGAQSLPVGQAFPLTMDLTGKLCDGASGGGTPTSPTVVSPAASATGGATPGHILSAASNNATSIKGSAGTLYELSWLQTTTTLMDIRLYDTASAPTCSSATGVVANYVSQSNTTSAGATINLGPTGKAFVNGIGICITGANADSDNSNAATGLNVNYSYK